MIVNTIHQIEWEGKVKILEQIFLNWVAGNFFLIDELQEIFIKGITMMVFCIIYDELTTEVEGTIHTYSKKSMMFLCHSSQCVGSVWVHVILMHVSNIYLEYLRHFYEKIALNSLEILEYFSYSQTCRC